MRISTSPGSSQTPLEVSSVLIRALPGSGSGSGSGTCSQPYAKTTVSGELVPSAIVTLTGSVDPLIVTAPFSNPAIAGAVAENVTSVPASKSGRATDPSGLNATV